MTLTYKELINTLQGAIRNHPDLDVLEQPVTLYLSEADEYYNIAGVEIQKDGHVTLLPEKNQMA